MKRGRFLRNVFMDVIREYELRFLENADLSFDLFGFSGVSPKASELRRKRIEAKTKIIKFSTK